MRPLVQKLRSPAVICAILLVGHGLLLAWSAAANSATFDEPAHLAAGTEYWRRGDFTIYSLSPPLLRFWAGLPALLARAKAPPTTEAAGRPIIERHWIYADAFVNANFSRFPFLLMLARWGMIPLSCAAGWVVYRWAGALYGAASGAAACAMYCLNPSILAQGSLVTTDLGTAAAILVSAWLWWRFCRRPSIGGWVGTCLAVVAAHLCKFTAVLLWPMLLVMAVPFVLAGPRSKWWKLAAAWVGLGAGTLLIVNCLYGFSGTGRKLSSFEFGSDFMQSVRRELPTGIRLPLPGLILEGMDAQKLDTQGGYQGFLFGEVYQGSRWYYYPAALLCKLPVSMLLLAAAAVASMLVRRRKPETGRRVQEWSVSLALAVFAIGVVALGDLNIGTRYLLPAFPLAMILISRIWSIDRPPLEEVAAKAQRGNSKPKREKNKFQRRGPRIEPVRRRAVAPYLRDGLLALLAVEMLWVCPRFLTFVNFAVGGPSNGWRLLSDSDFDWGQGLIDLRHWMKDQKVENVGLAYFGYLDPSVYGIHYEPITHRTKDEYIAVSSYYLNGLANRMVDFPHHRVVIFLPFFKFLQEKKPVYVAGNTMFIYSRHDVESAMYESMLGGPTSP